MTHETETKPTKKEKNEKWIVLIFPIKCHVLINIEYPPIHRKTALNGARVFWVEGCNIDKETKINRTVGIVLVS